MSVLDERSLELLMRAVDELLTPDEAAEFEALLAQRPELRSELDEMRGVKVRTDALAARIRATAPTESPPARHWITGTTALVVSGMALLAGYGGYMFFGDPEVPTAIRVGVGAMVAGAAGLFGYVLLGVLRSGKDPYEEIDR